MSEQDSFSRLFAPEPAKPECLAPANPWKVMLVDDEADIRAVLRLALQDVKVEGRPLQLLEADSAEEAKVRLAEHPDVALILLDVVMESEQAGLELVRYIRRQLGNRIVRILVVTGQPGYAPEREVVVKFEIDGYWIKPQLSSDRIFVLVYSELRTYRAMAELAHKRQQLDAAEEKLASRQKLLAAIVESSDDAIISKDLDGIVTSWNKGAEDIFGYTAQEMVGRSIRTLIPADRGDEEDRVLATIRRGESVKRYETLRVRKDGILINVAVGASPLRDGSGRIIGASKIARDITGRVEAEKRLRQSERDLRSILDNLPSMIGYWDASLHNRFANHAYATWFGFDPEQIPGKHIRDVIGAERYRLNLPYIEAALRGEPQTFERVIPSPDGSGVRHSLAHYIPDAQDGEVHGFYVLVSDITPLKLVQAELEAHRNHLEELVFARTAELAQALDDAEAASRAKTVFLATMSHELRTPMNGIMGMTDLALRRATDPRQIDCLNKSKGAAKHLLTVINDILDISKIESDRLTLEEKPFSVAQTIDDALQMQEAVAQAKGLALSQDISPALPDLLCGDAMRLRQILINFLGNAIKFSERGQITVRASAVEADSRSVLVRIEVTDQGIGLSPEQQDRLFRPFVQADGSMTRKYGGTGLGLVISKRIALLMGGNAGVISQEGQGSTFWATVRLRLAAADARADVAQAASSPREMLARSYAGRRVLVVEDDPLNQEVEVFLLEDADLVPDVAGNGQEALAMARKGGYALILMDVQMPVMNGLESTRAIRQLPGMKDIPILAMTANAFNENREECLAAGMNAHVGKPMEPGAFYATLLEWLQRSAAPVSV
jgi:PAS domain S-box-containing protein